MQPAGGFRHYDLVMTAFVTVLLVSNIASAARIVKVWIFTFDAGTLLFPLAYIFGDILTEVYGYARARRVIWVGFTANALMSGIIMLVGLLPWAGFGPSTEAYHEVLGFTPRIVIASLIAYWVGAFSNSFVLAKMKVWTRGKLLWARTIGSTIVGQGTDTVVFVLVAFLGAFAGPEIMAIIISNYVFKVGVEVAFTPITYLIVGWLKRTEGADYYDRGTNFNPFRLGITRRSRS